MQYSYRHLFTLALFLLVLSGAVWAAPTCAQLGTDPVYGLVDNKVITTVKSHLVAATGTVPGHCRVDIVYSGKAGPKDGYAPGEAEAIKIAVWLPLNSADGGSGATQGSWNGKVVNVGGGGCAGNISENSPRLLNRLKEGYVATNTDTGWKGCDDGIIQATHQLDLGKLNDFIYDGVHEQSVWGQTIAKSYYSAGVSRNYWVGCSTGGRQGLALAQKWGDEFDGILVGSPAIYWQEFRLADAWPQLVNRDKLIAKGKGLTAGQFVAANNGAVAACDALDGVKDGIVSDSRMCTWSATHNICGKPGAPEAPDCLDADQAAAIDMMWDGPRNHAGTRIWYPVDRGIPMIFPHSLAQNASQFGVGDLPTSTAQVMQFNHRDLTFNVNNLFLDRVALAAAGNPTNGIVYEDEAALGSANTEDYMGTMDANLDKLKAHSKMILWHGTGDPLIRWQGTMDYYRRVAENYGGYRQLQPWFRFFLSPGSAHCQDGDAGSPIGIVADDPTLFNALVNWVEHDKPPNEIPAKQTVDRTVVRTRPMCPYPTTAVYNGSGDQNDGANFHCGGNLETKEAIEAGKRTKYKSENK